MILLRFLLVILSNKNWHAENLIARRPLFRIYLEQSRDHSGKVGREGSWDLRVLALNHLVVEAFHILSGEGRS